MHASRRKNVHTGFNLLLIDLLYGNNNHYQLPLLLTAFLHVDLINIACLTHVPLSGHDDVALFD